MTREWLQFPVGRHAADWRTAGTRRAVLAVVHTVASAGHVLDSIEALESDHQVQIVFAQAPDLFSNGVPEYLRDLGAVVIPWQQATQTTFDLILAADNGGIHELTGPILLLSHGVMNNKLAATALSGPASGLVCGLGAPWLTWYGRLVPAAVAVSHPGVVQVLAEQCPQAVPIAALTGDLCLDRLVASRAHRQRYRRALGVADARTVVAVTSTWGPDSLLGRSWDALFDLLGDLPAATHSTWLTIHPACWHGHGPRQVLGWLREPRRAGLRLVEPTNWRGLIAAADVVIGDHGSATSYAAAAGIPVLRAPVPPGTTAANSAWQVLGRVAPELRTDLPLAAQLDAAVVASHDPDYALVAPAVTAEPGRAAALLRREMYRLMALPEPRDECETVPVGPPVPVRR